MRATLHQNPKRERKRNTCTCKDDERVERGDLAEKDKGLRGIMRELREVRMTVCSIREGDMLEGS